MTKPSPEAIAERDQMFLERIAEPLGASSVRRQYVKHAPTNLTIGEVLLAAENAHPHRVVTAELNPMKGITLTIKRKVGER